MYDLNDLIFIGRIIKTSGFKGQLIIRFDKDLILNFSKEPVFLNIEGKPVPFFIDSFQKRTKSEALIQLYEIDSWEEADKLCGSDIYLISDSNHKTKPNELLAEGRLLEGYEVYLSNAKLIGIVKEYIKREYQDLLVIDDQGTEHLLPWHQDFIINIDHEKRKLFINPPDGIFEISNNLNIV